MFHLVTRNCLFLTLQMFSTWTLKTISSGDRKVPNRTQFRFWKVSHSNTKKCLTSALTIVSLGRCSPIFSQRWELLLLSKLFRPDSEKFPIRTQEWVKFRHLKVSHSTLKSVSLQNCSLSFPTAMGTAGPEQTILFRHRKLLH